MEIRDLRTLDEFRAVRELELEIWGAASADDAVGVSLFAVSVKRGGILLGACDGPRLAGFAFSFPAIKAGRLLHWSHMLGVRPRYRGAGLGRRLKLEQRCRALAMDVRVMEWTFDPLQAANAHLNLAVLGATASEYLWNVYGDSASPLHVGTPTDRLVAEWRLDAPSVAERAGDRDGCAPARGWDARAAGAPPAIECAATAGWDEPRRTTCGLGAARVRIPVPPRFSEMLQAEPDLALAWRLATRDAFTAYLGRGYRAVDFLRDDRGAGAYVLSHGGEADDLTAAGA